MYKNLRVWHITLLLALGLTACTIDQPVDGGGSSRADAGDEDAPEQPDSDNTTQDDTGQPGDIDNEPDMAPDMPDTPGCETNLDCRGGEVCREGQCLEACAADDPCTTPDTFCDLERGTCVERECTQDDDCQGGFTCQDNICEPIDEIVCEANQTSCREGLLQTCNRDGTRLSTEDCGEGSICVEEDNAASCQALLCEPFSVGCVDANTAFVCDDNGTTQTPLPCRDDQRCQDGACEALACSPGSRTCQGDNLQICNEDGTSAETVACNDTADCADTDFGCFCADNDCQERICQPNTGRCVGNAVQTCDAEGSSWGSPVPCAAEQTCNAGRCVTDELDCDSPELGQDNLGCSFWTMDLDNLEGGERAPHAVVVLNPDPTETLEVTIRRDGGEVQLAATTVNPGRFLVHEFPTDYELEDTGLYDGRAWEVTTTKPALAYQFNPLRTQETFSNDASLLLPSSAAGTSYMGLTWPGRAPFLVAELPESLTVVAVEPNTTRVTITTTVNIPEGNGLPALNAGEPTTVIMGRGQVIHLSRGTGPLTGTTFTSTRKISVFSSHQCAVVPDDTVGFCDHIEEQLPPMDTWGTSFVAAPFQARSPSQVDNWKLVAGTQDVTLQTTPNTSWNGMQVAAGQSVNLTTGDAFVLNSTGPVLLGHFLQGAQFEGSMEDPRCNNGNGIGDPAFTLTPAQRQFKADYTFYSPEAYAENYLNLMVPAGAQVSLDNGGPLAQGTTIGGFWYGQFPISAGIHTLTSDVPFGAVIYGYDCSVSFAAPAGLALPTND